MGFFSDKWKNSSILTKVSLWPMMIGTLLLLICTFVLLSWDRMFISQGASQEAMGGFRFLLFFYIIAFLYNALLCFGIFKVNNFARTLTILLGLGSVIAVIFAFGGFGVLMSYARQTVGDQAVDAAAASYKASAGLAGKLFTNVIIPLIPANVLAKIGFYIFIFITTPVLQVLSMLILLFCKKDFTKKKDQVTQTAAP